MTVRVNLHLDVHSLPLDLPVENEAIYRRAADMLNERFAYYRRTQPKASAEQLWLYVALEMAVNLTHDARAKSLEPIEQKLEILNQLIQENLCSSTLS